MGTEYINGKEFYRIFTFGAEKVISHKEHLNKINVFPVADGDTGSNLEVTLRSVIDFTQVSVSFSETAISMANSIVLGARGNSGVIFAQYIKGIAEGAKGKENIHFKEFINLNSIAAQKILEVIAKPIEGTIITVIRSWAQYLKLNENNIESFEELFDNSLEEAKIALAKTTYQIPVLQKNNVVDSGGRGFVYFLEGMRNYIVGEKSNEADIDYGDEGFAFKQIDHQKEISKYRYCCECILLESNYFKEDIIREIEYLGDSIICLESDDKRHVHIHTNSPQQLFEKLVDFGNISRPKIDDMFMQAQTLNDRFEIGLVTDSIADLPLDILDKYHIHTLNLNIQMGKSQFIDKLGISREKVYEYMKSSKYPSSSMPNEKQIMEKLEELSKLYKNLIVITVSAKMSGVYDVIKSSATKLNSNCNVKVIDSRLNSAAQGMLVYKAAKRIFAGNDFETVIDNIKIDSKQIEIYVALSTLKNVVKSGRVDKKSIKLASNANLKAAISIDREGNGISTFVSPSHSSLLNKILNIAKVKKYNNEIGEYAISYSGNCKHAVDFAEKLEALLGFPPLFIAEVSSVTALHVGEGAVGVTFSE